MREKQKQERLDLKSALFSSKHQEASQLKNQKAINEQRIRLNFEGFQKENFKKRVAVSKDKVIGKVNISDFQEKKSSIGRSVYLTKIEENERMMMDKQRELENMERLEFEMIKRLQNTQVIKDHALMELETMIRPGMKSVYNSMVDQRKDSFY